MRLFYINNFQITCFPAIIIFHLKIICFIYLRIYQFYVFLGVHFSRYLYFIVVFYYVSMKLFFNLSYFLIRKKRSSKKNFRNEIGLNLRENINAVDIYFSSILCGNIVLKICFNIVEIFIFWVLSHLSKILRGKRVHKKYLLLCNISLPLSVNKNTLHDDMYQVICTEPCLNQTAQNQFWMRTAQTVEWYL